jgi:hemoglobin
MQTLNSDLFHTTIYTASGIPPGGMRILEDKTVRNIRTFILGLCMLMAFSISALAQQKSLYERLGGEEGISAVVDDFAQNVLADARINKKFAKSDAPRLLTNLKAFVCFATGGPCKYTGLDMKTSHKNMGVTAGEFNALVEDLVKTLDKFRVPAKEKNELLSALAGLRKDIVERESPATGGELPAAFKPAPPLAAVASAPAQQKSLYERLGGKDAISAVVDDFAQNVLADTRINKKFARSDAPRLLANLKDFVCFATGGPCQYTGLDMKTSHKNMGVTAGEFNALVEDLVKTLDKLKVPAKEKNELLGALAGLRKDIVESESPATGGELPAAFQPAPPLGTVASAPAQQKSLYERLGGKDAISAVVDDFAQNVLTDARINKKFARSDAPRLLTNLKEFVCFATGGPCRYTGLDMKTSHKNMGVTAGEFTALVEDLVKTLDKFKVPEKEKNELLGALAGLRGDIVESESSTTGGELPAAFQPAPPLGESRATVAAAPAPAPAAPVRRGGSSLYERLGGKDAISAVVDDFAQNVLTDPRINKKFVKSDPVRLVSNLKDFVCVATGGPCRYFGLDMKKSHKRMGVTAGEFNALVEDLVKTLDKFKVPEKEKNELLGALAGLRGDIVEDESSATGGELPKKFKPAPPMGSTKGKKAMKNARKR